MRLMRAALVAWLLVPMHAPRAVAQASARAALHVEADAACATAESVVARVRARSSRIALEPGALIALRVAIAAEGEALRAELQILWPDGRRSSRSLKAPTCAAAADAVALLITLALDPKSARDDRSPARADASTPQDAPAPERSDDAQPVREAPASDAAATAPASTPSAATEPPPSPGPETAAASSAEAPSAEPAAAFSFAYAALGLAAQGVLGPAPQLMPGAAVIAQLAWDGPLPWSPLVQLRLERAWLESKRGAAGVAHFGLDALELSACPLGARSAMLSAHACGMFEIGSLSARGTETYDPQRHARLWLSLGTELLFGIRVLGPVALQLGAGLAWPLRRDRFAFAPAVFHRVAGTLVQAHAGLAVRFP